MQGGDVTSQQVAGSSPEDDNRLIGAPELAGGLRTLEAVAALDPPPATLHLYAQPTDPGFLDAQRGYAEAHPLFEVEHLDAASHFPVLEVPDAVAAHVKRFVGR